MVTLQQDLTLYYNNINKRHHNLYMQALLSQYV